MESIDHRAVDEADDEEGHVEYGSNDDPGHHVGVGQEPGEVASSHRLHADVHANVTGLAGFQVCSFRCEFTLGRLFPDLPKLHRVPPRSSTWFTDAVKDIVRAPRCVPVAEAIGTAVKPLPEARRLSQCFCVFVVGDDIGALKKRGEVSNGTLVPLQSCWLSKLHDHENYGSNHQEI